MPKSSDVLYHAGPLRLTRAMLRFKGRRYALAHIENLILKRPLFWMAASLSVLLAGVLWFNQDILYPLEILVLSGAAILLPLLAFPFGTLHVHSKLLGTNEGTITYFYRDLLHVQNILEGILDARTRAAWMEDASEDGGDAGECESEES